MKRIALALIACAGLGFLAGQKPATSENVAVVACTPAPSWVEENARHIPDPPAQTPLVEKLLPKPAKVQEQVQEEIRDGQLSPGKQFSFSEARNAWIPVDKGNRRFTENGHAPTAEHLIREHGHARSSAEKWTPEEREIAHANSHAASRGVTRSANVLQESNFRNTSSCPNGQCGNPSRSRGFLRRR